MKIEVTQALQEFRAEYLKGELDFDDAQATHFEDFFTQLSKLQTVYGFDYGRQNGFVQLKETIGSILAVEGFVPTLAELEKLSLSIESRLLDPAQLEGVQWDLSMLQKFESVYDVIYGKRLRLSPVLFQKLFPKIF